MLVTKHDFKTIAGVRVFLERILVIPRTLPTIGMAPMVYLTYHRAVVKCENISPLICRKFEAFVRVVCSPFRRQITF